MLDWLRLSARSKSSTSGPMLWQQTRFGLELHNASVCVLQVRSASLVYPASDNPIELDIACLHHANLGTQARFALENAPVRPICWPKQSTELMAFTTFLEEGLHASVLQRLQPAALHVTYSIVGFPPLVQFRAKLPFLNHCHTTGQQSKTK